MPGSESVYHFSFRVSQLTQIRPFLAESCDEMLVEVL